MNFEVDLEKHKAKKKKFENVGENYAMIQKYQDSESRVETSDGRDGKSIKRCR